MIRRQLAVRGVLAVVVLFISISVSPAGTDANSFFVTSSPANLAGLLRTAGPFANAPDDTDPRLVLSALVWVDFRELMNAPVPSLCGHSNGKLVNGQLPGIAEGEGAVFLRPFSLLSEGGKSSSNTIVTGIDPRASVAAVVSCNRGGVSWPDAVVVWNSSFELTAWADLRKTQGSRGRVDSIKLKGDKLLVRWTYQDGGDVACCGTYSAEGWAETTDGEELELESIAVSHGEDVVLSALTAAGSRNSAKMRASVPPDRVSVQAWRAVTRIADLGIRFDYDSLKCLGGPLYGGTYKGRDLPTLEYPVSCSVQLDNGELVLFGLSYEAWNDYEVESAYVA